MGRLEYFCKAAMFVARKHLIGFDVDPIPSFQPEALGFFNTIIPQTKIYIEYGSGGSTIVAAQHVEILISVESDPIFSRAVAARIAKDSKAEIHLLCPNVGITAHWGTPVFGRPTPSRARRWQKYPQAPWHVLGTTRAR
jgi:hypothetical protein